MATTTDLEKLVINYLTQDQYDDAREAGTLNANELYLTPDTGSTGGTVTSVATGGGLTGGTITTSGTISHDDTSSQSSVSNSGRTYIQSVTLDTYGHVTGLTSASESVTNTDENMKWTASTSSNTYYPLQSTSTATTSTANTLNGISFYQYYNTAGGYRRLDLGNATAWKSTGGAYGTIRLYGAAATYYGDLVPGVLGTTSGDGHISANRTWTLPDKTGTIALTSDIPTVPTKTSDLNNDSGFVTSSGVTSIATTSPISGGTITTTGTISHATSGVGTATTTAGFYKFKYDTYGHVTGVSSVTASDITGLVTIPTNTDENVKSTAVTAATTNYIVGSTTSTTTTGGLSKHASAVLYTTADSGTSGYAQLRLGNTTATTSAGGKEGQIRLYGTNATYYLDLKPGAIASSNKTITFPNKTGTVALTSDIPTVPTKTSDLTNDSGFITSDTKNTTGSSSKTGTKMYLIGATSQDTYVTTYSNANCYIDASNNLFSNGSIVVTPAYLTDNEYAQFDDIPTITLNGTATTSPSFYAPTSAGTNGYVLKSNGSGAPTWTSAVLTDTQVTSAPVTTATTYYLTGSTSSANTTGGLSKHASINAYVTADTSTSGYAYISIGNSTASGAVNAKQGYLRLYGTTAYYHELKGVQSYPSANRSVYFPRYAGDMYLTCVPGVVAVGGATTAPVYVDSTGTIKSVTSIPYSLLSDAPDLANYLPLTGGDLSGNLRLNADSGVGRWTITRQNNASIMSSGVSTSGIHGLYSDKGSRWMIQAPADGSSVTINDGDSSHTYVAGDLTILGHDSPIGTVVTSDDVTIDDVASGGSLKVTSCSINVTPGVWIVNYYARFPANATGYRGIRLGIGTTSDITRSDIFCQASNSSTVTTRLAGSITQKLTSNRTYTLKVMQGSGSTMSGIVGGVVATRLA